MEVLVIPVVYYLGSLLVWRIGIWGNRLELCSVHSDNSGLCPVDSKSPWLVIMPKSKDWFIERPPMRIVQP
jgi:hypothetical protein